MRRRWSLIAAFAFAAAAIVAVSLFSGCSVGMLPPSRHVSAEAITPRVAFSSGTCVALDRDATAWTATTVVASVLSGGGGVSTIFTAQTPRIAISSTGVGLAALSALSTYLAAHYASQYAQGCTVNTGGNP